MTTPIGPQVRDRLAAGEAPRSSAGVALPKLGTMRLQNHDDLTNRPSSGSIIA
jgi:hypothetical protein